MSSKSTNKDYHKISSLDLKEPLKLKNLMIPYSKFSKSEKFIYYGHEKIPFHKRHPIYQKILKKEFAGVFKIFINRFKK